MIMTLFKQLFFGTSIAFLLILMGTEAVYIRNAHKYLQEQLASHAQDAATSLGMSLPVAMAEQDGVRAEVTVNAMFDRGYYQSIRVIDIKGKTVVLKTLAAAPVDVPQWFADWFPLAVPQAESLISQGWKQLGRVVVSSHPNFAYKQLWRTLVEASVGLLVLYILALFALNSFLTRILKPLRSIEKVAHAISDRDFQVVKTLPATRELRNVVGAINSMSNKLRGIIEYEVGQAIRFRDESTKDPLTDLKNRRGFEMFVEGLLQQDENTRSAAMFMLQISDFHDFNSRQGFRQGDLLLKEVGLALQSLCAGGNRMAARINGATFIVVAPNIDNRETASLGEAITTAVGIVVDGLKSDSGIDFGCGAVYFSGHIATLHALLSQCDLATLQSLSLGQRTCVLQELTVDEHAQGSQGWKQLIMDSIERERLALFSQPVIDIRKPGQEEIQIEVVGRLKNEQGEVIPAGEFIPMADRHGLTPAFDLAILKRLFGRMGSGMVTTEVAFNLSINSIHDKQLLDWLLAEMRSNRSVATRLVFEFTEFGIVQDQKGVESFVKQIRALGANFAVDNFGLHPNAFDYLQSLKPRYVKLSQTYLRDLETNQQHQFFI